MSAAGAASRWQAATLTAIVARTPTIKSFYFALPERLAFKAGQHMDVRLVADDGYEAQRSYSIASAPESGPDIELAIERLDDGEVSPFFHDVAQVGDAIDLRGPIGGHFVWSVADGGPVLLAGGGSGVVPLAAMARHHALHSSGIPMTLVASARAAADLLYADELDDLAAAGRSFRYIATLTRETGAAPDRRRGRIDRALLADALEGLGAPLRFAFVCGTNRFVEHVAQLLLALDVPAGAIRTERYGG